MDVNISPAVSQLYPHHYKPLSVVSLDYGEIVCDKFFECEKRDEWNSVKGNGFLRLAALDFPAYGRTYVKSAAFFVPYYQLLQNVDGTRQGLLSDRGKSCVTPHFGSHLINHLLGSSSYSTNVAIETNPANFPAVDTYDFCNVAEDTNNPGSSVFNFRKLNVMGKRYYKLLSSLGYEFQTPLSDTSWSAQVAIRLSVNAYTLLAYAKVYSDWFMNIHLYNTVPMVALLRAIADGDTYTFGGNTLYDSSIGELTSDGVKLILQTISVPFSSSLYSEAWNSVNSPLGVVNTDSSVYNQSTTLSPYLPAGAHTSDDLFLNTASTYIKNRSFDSLELLSHQGLNSLGAFFAFIQRNNLFGSEPARTALARFGIKGDDFNTLFARKLYENSQEIDFAAVMSNANTVNGANGSFLGAYAGVGLASFNFDYNYKCSDYGVILNLSWLQIDPIKLNGYDPAVLRMRAFDWFTPEWDGKASRAIPQAELGYAKKPTATSQNLGDPDIFGFCGVYDEYRQMNDTVVGDFRIGTAENFLFARNYGTLRRGLAPNVPQSVGMQYFPENGRDISLTDPFMYDSSNGDRFYLQIKWNIDAMRPIKSKSDSLQLNGEGNLDESTNSTPMN